MEERCLEILETKGGGIADDARRILLKESSLEKLQQPLRYISEKWRDPLTPALVVLSTEAVGAEPNSATYRAALAMTLFSLCFTVWDDLVDKTRRKGCIPTVPGRFGEATALIVGGLASAKAFSILRDARLEKERDRRITELVWNYCADLAKAEAANLELRGRTDVGPEEKLRVIEMQCVNLETMMEIGAVVGNGFESEIGHLGKYGKYLGMILELNKDFNVSLNLTIELAEKIESGSFTYTLLWARQRSEEAQGSPLYMNSADIYGVVKAVLETGALENTMSLLEGLAKKASKELCMLKTNEATQKLAFFVDSQPQLFAERLSFLLR